MLLQIALTFLALTAAVATTPPSYQKTEDTKTDKNGPKYNYGYKISNDKGSQEKQEQRDGIYALGRYNVHNVGTSQTVEYLADDWGYHPFISYSNVGPHSQSSAQIAFGEEAVKALHNSRKNAPNEQLQQIELNPVPHQQTKPIQKVTLVPKINRQPDLVYYAPQVQSKPAPQVLSSPAPTTHENFVYITPSSRKVPKVVSTSQPSIVYIPQNGGRGKQNVIYLTQPSTTSLPAQHQHQNLFLVNPHNVAHQENVLLLPTPNYPNYVYAQQNPYLLQVQPPPPPPTHHFQDSNGIQPSTAPLIQEQIYIKNVPQNIETVTKDVEQPSYVNPQVKTPNDYSQDSGRKEEDNYPQPGAYGTKINAKLTNINNVRTSKLIQTTKNLVTGEDVLNINEVLNQHQLVPSSTARAIVNSYSSKIKNVDIHTAESDSSSFSTTVSPIVSTTERIAISFSKDPIVVADLEENLLDEDRIYSTTQSTVETANTISSFGDKQTTVVVTPRPVSNSFLAPITAGIQLQSVENTEEEYVRPIPTEAKSNVVVEIQKSVPYYLGRFEFLQDPYSGKEAKIDSKEAKNHAVETEAQHNMDLGSTLLQYSAGGLPTPQALVQEQPVPEYVGNNIDAKSKADYQNAEEVDQKQESGQVDYQVQQLVGSPTTKQYQVHDSNQDKEQVPNTQQPFVVIGKQNPFIQQQQQQNLQEQNKNLAQPINNAPQAAAQVMPTQPPQYVTVDAQIHPGDVQNYFIQQQQAAQNLINKQNSVFEYKLPTQPPQEQVQFYQLPPQQQLIESGSVQQPTIQQYIAYPPLTDTNDQHKQPPAKPIENNPPPVPTQQSYIVEVPKPYPVHVTKLVPQPYPVTLTKTVQIPVPTPVEVKIPHPVPVEVPKYIDRPYPVYLNSKGHPKHKVPNVYAPNYQANCEHAKHHLAFMKQQAEHQKYHNQRPKYTRPHHHHSHHHKHHKTYLPLNHSYYNSLRANNHTPKQPFYTNLPPITKPNNQLPNPHTTDLPRKHRNARHSFGGSNLRIEYGFMPPLIPSIEIDENGKPIDKTVESR